MSTPAQRLLAAIFNVNPNDRDANEHMRHHSKRNETCSEYVTADGVTFTYTGPCTFRTEA